MATMIFLDNLWINKAAPNISPEKICGQKFNIKLKTNSWYLPIDLCWSGQTKQRRCKGGGKGVERSKREGKRDNGNKRGKKLWENWEING